MKEKRLKEAKLALKHLKAFRENASDKLRKFWIVDPWEMNAIEMTIETLQDCIAMSSVDLNILLADIKRN